MLIPQEVRFVNYLPKSRDLLLQSEYYTLSLV
jgi:hypothetical protein